MGQREQDILSEARITLNDVVLTNKRWSDKRLMQLLSEGQDDLCRNIPMIVRKATINPVSGQEEYKLPIGCVKLLHANTTYSDFGTNTNRASVYPLVITSYDEIERDNPTWESDFASEFTAIVVNALSQRTIRPYPLLAENTTVLRPIGVRYQAMPIALGWDEVTEDSIEEITIDEMWDFGLKQYVIGMAFLDYGDQASISRSEVALGLYGKEASKAQKLAKKSFSKRSVTTNYRAKVASLSSINSSRRNGGFRSSLYNFR